MKVLLVDDHPVARRGMTVIIRDSLKDSAVIEADNAELAVKLAVTEAPDLILLDARMPDSIPVSELCRLLRAAAPSAKISIVTAFEDASELRDCLSAGATGCLLKDTSEIDLGSALRNLLAGEVVIDPRIADRLARALVQSPSSRVKPLTSREADVLSLLAQGASNRAIAGTLDLSEATVKGYVTTLFEKLGATSRLEAVIRAYESGLVELNGSIVDV
jgi:two-component system nitrate/nitrite response regulator NarL